MPSDRTAPRLPRVVLTNATFAETRAMFDGVAELAANDRPEPWPGGVLLDRCRDADAVMAFMTDRIDDAFLAQCPRLRVIGAALKGFDNIDVDAATARGVWVTICDDLLTIPTAELAVGLTISVARNIRQGDREIRANGFAGWRPTLYGTGLAGASVGIAGFGKVGQAIAERLAGFGCRIAAFDTDTAPFPERFSSLVGRASLDRVLTGSDYVVLALPLTPETLHIVDAAALATMKPGAILVNPARGSLVDEAAVADALQSGHLAAYAADVFECEDWARTDRPRSVEPRLTAPDAPTVLTPHIGSAVREVRMRIEAEAAANILDVLQGRAPRGAINDPRSGLRRPA